MRAGRHFGPGNRLLRLLLVNALAGGGVAAVFLAVVLATDTFRMGTLIATSDAPVLVTIILYCMLVVTFSSVAMGSAIMRIGHVERSRPPRGGLPITAAVPIRASASTRR